MTASGDYMTQRRDDEQEMTMEEILASIRKYVTEDGTPAANSSGNNYRSAHETESEEEVLDLKHASHNVIEHPELAHLNRTATTEPLNHPSQVAQETHIVMNQGSIASENMMSASAESLSRLVETVKYAKEENAPMSHPSENVHAHSQSTAHSTLEKLAIEAMTPMVQSWLNSNLSQLVEKLVQKEIQRITQELLRK